MQRLFQILVSPLIDYFGIEHVAIFIANPSSTGWDLLYSTGFPPESIPSLQNLKDGTSVLKRLIDTRIPQIVNDVSETEKDLSSLTESQGLSSMIAVPIFTDRKLWAILTAFSPEKHKFKEEDARIINLFAGQSGRLTGLFSQCLKESVDELSIQVLGSVELVKFKSQERDTIPALEILHEQERLKKRVLSYLADMEHKLEVYESGKEEAKKREAKPLALDELSIEEVITIHGGKNQPPGADKKVLIIDDQPLVCDLLVSVLERMNYRSEVALCGRDGLELFEKGRFDLVMTDLGMPDISGWEVSKAVKEKKPDLPVVVITGWGIDPDPDKMKDSKVDLIITKPFQIDQLEKIIRELLER
ncbi:MAG: response regulator [Candidatus Zixiibacteriota bacterium]